MKDEKLKKSRYVPLEIEVIRFDSEDVITSSGGGDDDTEPIDPFG